MLHSLLLLLLLLLLWCCSGSLPNQLSTGVTTGSQL
jgi:hypothetical protein